MKVFIRLHNEEFQEELIRYFMGVGGVQVTYDSVFKHTFNPERHPKRLSRLLSQLIGEDVTVKKVLPITLDRLSEKGSLLIMQLELLQKYIFISLDNFGKISQNKGIETELEAWLHFLISTDITSMCNIINAYPWFKELYEDLARFRNQPEEMIRMYSDALKTLDYNTVQYMIEQQRLEIERLKQQCLL